MNRRDEYLRKALCVGSWAAYRSAWRSYTRALGAIGIFDVLPLQESHLELYVASVAHRLAAGTVDSYLSGIKFIHSFAGYSLDGLFGDRLSKLKQGVKRAQGASMTRPKRLPVTVEDLADLIQFSTRNFGAHDATLFSAVSVLAFFGMLRVSEFTCPGTARVDVAVHLLLSDISFETVRGTSFAIVRIKRSKTDQFCAGVVVRIAFTSCSLCPGRALLRYLHFRRPLGPGPLFILGSGQFLVRAHVVQLLAAVFPEVPQGLLGSHSFRIGGASRLCVLGVPDATIQVLGRWSSSAFKKYLRLSSRYVAELHQRMAELDPHSG